MTRPQSPPTKQDIDFFRRLTLSLCSSLDLEKALERCLQTLQGRIPAEDMFLILDAPWLGGLHVLAQASLPGIPRLDKNIQLPPETLDATLKHRFTSPTLVNDTSKHPNCLAVASYVKNQGFSEILLPVSVQGKRQGMLVIRARGNNRYTPEHLQLVLRVHDPIAMAVVNAVKHMELLRLKEELRDENRYLRRKLYPQKSERIIGENNGLREVMSAVRQVAPLNNTVLLLGETGVGKEVIAGAIHKQSARSEGPFVKVNCGAIPENLIDSELFGHARGAFSGASESRKGRFERAQGGTLFLDEIGELPLQVQARLLRAIQTREIEPLGGSGPLSVDIRIIAATHRNLEQMAERGRFREDLLFRINAFPIRIPALRERPDDIGHLTRYFIEKKARELGYRQAPEVSWPSLEHLKAMPWPGNVRELENFIERELIRSRGAKLSFAPAPQGREADASKMPPDAEASGKPAPPAPLEQALGEHIRRTLQRTGGRIHGPKGAAELLDIHPSTLRHRMKKMGIPYGRACSTPSPEN